MNVIRWNLVNACASVLVFRYVHTTYMHTQALHILIQSLFLTLQLASKDFHINVIDVIPESALLKVQLPANIGGEPLGGVA